MITPPKRVLHIVGAMNRGGVETWLMHVLRKIDAKRVQMDFLVHSGTAGLYDAEILENKSQVIRCTESTHSVRYPFRIAEILRRFGPYDVVHSHVHHFSGCLLRISDRANIPIRIAHSHSDSRVKDRLAGWFRQRYLRLTEEWIRQYATHLVGASDVAARALFGSGWSLDSRGRLLHCGIDLKPFGTVISREKLRGALGVGKSEFVIGHVGRLDTPKNHAFLAEIASQVIAQRPETRLLLIGDGPLRRSLEARVQQLGIAHRTIFAGDRGDVASLLNAMDVFVFPSLWEGLPLTVLEAQAAGIPCVISDVISSEVDIVPALIKRLSLALDSTHWAQVILGTRDISDPDKNEALAMVANSDFNICRSIEGLLKIYAA